MKLKLLNVVVFAEKYEDLVKWYKDTFNLEIILQENGAYHYTELGIEQRVIVGITPAEELKHIPNKSKNNSCVMQLEVSDIKELFKNVTAKGGTILFGPSFENHNKFYYGGISDIEGNQIWITEEKK